MDIKVWEHSQYFYFLQVNGVWHLFDSIGTPLKIDGDRPCVGCRIINVTEYPYWIRQYFPSYPEYLQIDEEF